MKIILKFNLNRKKLILLSFTTKSKSKHTKAKKLGRRVQCARKNPGDQPSQGAEQWSSSGVGQQTNRVGKAGGLAGDQ